MSKNQKKGPAFLLKTYDMLQKQEFKQIIDWIPDGTGFVVKSPTQLAQKVLPKYFKHSNMHSFIRQLNMYGFNKKRGSKTQNYYFHRLFHKGKRDMIGQMQRKAEKKGTNKQLPKQSQQHEDVSIEVEEQDQQSHDQDKENKNVLMPENLVPDQNRRRKDSQVQQNQMKKSLVDIAAFNKVMLLEQVYHLASIQANNLLTYHQKRQQDLDQTDHRVYGRDLLERFERVKNKYLGIHSLICDKANSYVQIYENQLVKNWQASSKVEKPTEVQIIKKQEQEDEKEKENEREKEKEDEKDEIESFEDNQNKNQKQRQPIQNVETPVGQEKEKYFQVQNNQEVSVQSNNRLIDM